MLKTSELNSHGIQSHQCIEVSVPYAIGGMKNQVFAMDNPESMLYFQCRHQIDLKYASKCFIFYAPTSNHSPSIIPCHAGRWTLYGIAGFSLTPSYPSEAIENLIMNQDSLGHTGFLF